jgi:hypothetical protein
MRKDGAVFEETDVLPSKLDSAGFGALRGHGVFSGTQEEEKSNGE